MEKLSAKKFQVLHKLNSEDYDRLLSAGNRICAYLDNHWSMYQLPVPRKRIYDYWRTFPKQLDRDAGYRFLGTLGYYTIVPSPAGKEYVFAKSSRLDEEQMLMKVFELEKQEKLQRSIARKKNYNDKRETD